MLRAEETLMRVDASATLRAAAQDRVTARAVAEKAVDAEELAWLTDRRRRAKGILMERQRLSAGEAFDVLRRVSQRLNRRLAEVAEHLARTGELPR